MWNKFGGSEVISGIIVKFTLKKKSFFQFSLIQFILKYLKKWEAKLFWKKHQLHCHWTSL